MQKSESYRINVARALTIVVFSFILTGFAFYEDLISFNNNINNVATNKNLNENYGQLASVASVNLVNKNVGKNQNVPSPIENTKETFKNFFDEIEIQFNNLKDSVSSVIVPFITSIDIYQR